MPKGGQDRSFTVPLSKRVLELLRRRKEENNILFGLTPFVFPTRSRRSGKVTYIRECRLAPKAAKEERSPTPHRLRDTFATAAREAGVPMLELKLLMNHRLPNGDVTEGYIRPDVEFLRGFVEQVAEFLEQKMKDD